MKGYMLLAFTFTIAQAVAYGLTRVPVNYIRQANVGPRVIQMQGWCPQNVLRMRLTSLGGSALREHIARTPLYAAQRYYGLSGRPEFSETYQQESGNLYDGQREGRFYARDSIDNVRGLQYSLRPGTEYPASRGQFNRPYNQQFRSQDGFRSEGFGQGAGRGQIAFRAPLANTRSYNPQFEPVGSY